MTVKKTILCVDDEHSLSIQKVLLETRGYRVVTCNTGEEALSIFKLGSVDLVLSNVDLPDALARELAKRTKALSPEVPVVLLSAQKWAFHTDERIRLLLVKRRGPRRAASAATESRVRAC